MDKFEALNTCVFLRRPSSINRVLSSVNDPPPSTILFFPWLGALPRHFSKFLTYYTSRYPTARILVIVTGNSDLIYRSYATQEKRLEPALQIILADSELDGKGEGCGRLLAHAFSNGGANALTNLLHAFHQRTGKPMPLQALVLDSSPGRANLIPLVDAMRMSLSKQRYLQLPIMIFVVALLAVLWAVHRAFELENAVDRLRRLLNDPHVLQLEAKRFYVYSKSDKLVKWEDVEEHADGAARQGYDVVMEKFEESEHVCHMRMDQVKYWSTLEKFWESAVKGVL